MFESFALSVRGSSHIRENIARQDYTNTYTDPAGWAMAAVSDGHGGDDYFRSHIGSRFAVESAMSCIKECLAEKKILLDTLREGENAREKFFRRLASSIMTGWRAYIETFEEAVKAYDGASETAAVQFDFGALTIQQQLPGGEDAFVQDGISLAWEEAWCAEHEVKRSETRPERLYGCTLLVAVMAPEFCFSLQIGDGCCVLADANGHTKMMIPVEEEHTTNITDSLCEARALEKFKHTLLLAAEEKENLTQVTPQAGKPEKEPEAEAPTAEAPGIKEPTDEAPNGGIPETETPAEPQAAEPAQEPKEEEGENDPPCAAMPVGILLSSDGLFNSCNTAEDFLQFNRAVLARMQPDGRDAFAGELAEHLALRSKKGSADDISIALVFHADIEYDALRG